MLHYVQHDKLIFYHLLSAEGEERVNERSDVGVSLFFALQNNTPR
jgi:hypothetical protein